MLSEPLKGELLSCSFSDHLDIDELHTIFQELLEDEWLGSPGESEDQVLDYVVSYSRSNADLYCLRDDLGEVVCFAEIQLCPDFKLNSLTIFTPTKYRGMGYGFELAAELLDRELFDIYVCAVDNVVSFNLAQSLGLEPFKSVVSKRNLPYYVFTRTCYEKSI